MSQKIGQKPAVSELKPLVWVLLGFIILRIYPLLAYSHSYLLVPDSGDTQFYQQWALKILQGEWSDGKAFYGLPGYPFLLATIYHLFGLNFLVISFLQFILDALTGVFLFLITRYTLAGDTKLVNAPALLQGRNYQLLLPYLAALSWALFQPSQAFSLILMPTAWTICLYWGIILLLAQRRGVLSSLLSLLIGLAIGIAAMVVATILALVPLATIACWCSQASLRTKLLVLPLLIAGVLIGTSPCWIHNRFVADEPVFLSAHGGLNLYVGNNALTNGYPKIPPELRATQSEMLLDSIAIAQKADGRELSHAEVSAYWSDRANAWITANPGDWLQLLGTKVANFWNAFEYDDLSALLIMRENGILLPGLAFWPLALLGLPGLVLALWRGNFTARLVAGGVLAHLLVLLPVFITERYRLPAAPGLIVLACVYLHTLVSAILSKKWTMPAICLLMLGLSAVLIFQPRDASLTYHNLYNSGRAALAAGKYELAERKLLEAEQFVPDNAEIQFSLGNLQLALENRHAAKLRYRRTLEFDPRHDRAWNNLAIIAMQEDRLDLAEKFIGQSIALAPTDAKSHYILALILEKLQRPEEAKAAAQKALELSPGQPDFVTLLQRLEQPKPKE